MPRAKIPILHALATSVSGQLRRSDCVSMTSDLPRQADIFSVRRHVSKVPEADFRQPQRDRNLAWRLGTGVEARSRRVSSDISELLVSIIWL